VNEDKAGTKCPPADTTGDENPIQVIKDLADWQFAWARAVARAWRDPRGQWAQLLLSGNEAEVGRAFFELGFQLPPGFKLTVRRAPDDSQYDETAWKRVPAVNGWNGQEAGLGAKVVMYLPNSPADSTLHAMALTDYNALGENYPFTF